MPQPITDQKIRADLTYEVNQGIQVSMDFLRTMKDTKDGLLPDASPGQTGSRAGRVNETVWSLYEDVLRSTARVIIANNTDKETLIALLRGADLSSVPAPTLGVHDEPLR